MDTWQSSVGGETIGRDCMGDMDLSFTNTRDSRLSQSAYKSACFACLCELTA